MNLLELIKCRIIVSLRKKNGLQLTNKLPMYIRYDRVQTAELQKNLFSISEILTSKFWKFWYYSIIQSGNRQRSNREIAEKTFFFDFWYLSFKVLNPFWNNCEIVRMFNSSPISCKRVGITVFEKNFSISKVHVSKYWIFKIIKFGNTKWPRTKQCS